MSILRRFTDFILQSRLQAMGVAFVCSYVSVLESVGLLIAGLVTLRKGATEGLCIVFAITLPFVLKYYSGSFESDTLFVGLLVNILCKVFIWLWLFALLLRRYNNWSMVLEYSALLGVMVVGLLHVCYPDIQSWWSTQLVNYFNKTAEVVKGLPRPSLTDVQRMAVIASGLFVVILLSNVMLQLILSRWWQAAMFNPGGLRTELHQIRLSHVLGILFIVGLSLAWWGSATMMDVTPVLCAVFGAAGLSFMHYYFSTIKNTLVWLIILYSLIILLFPISIILLALVALIDVWMDLRKRLTRTS